MNITIRNLNYYFSDKKALDNISMELKENQSVAIIGHNGAGKTTLIKCLVNEFHVNNETVFLDNVDINKFTHWTSVGYVPQDIDSFSAGFPLTVVEFLTTFHKEHNKKIVLEKMKEAKIYHLRKKDINKLSGGEKRRVFIARALLNDIKLLILDEPIVAVDVDNKKEISLLLESLTEKGISIICITHNYEDIKNLITHVCLIEKKIIFYGTKELYEEKYVLEEG